MGKYKDVALLAGFLSAILIVGKYLPSPKIKHTPSTPAETPVTIWQPPSAYYTIPDPASIPDYLQGQDVEQSTVPVPSNWTINPFFGVPIFPPLPVIEPETRTDDGKKERIIGY